MSECDMATKRPRSFRAQVWPLPALTPAVSVGPRSRRPLRPALASGTGAPGWTWVAAMLVGCSGHSSHAAGCPRPCPSTSRRCTP